MGCPGEVGSSRIMAIFQPLDLPFMTTCRLSLGGLALSWGSLPSHLCHAEEAGGGPSAPSTNVPAEKMLK